VTLSDVSIRRPVFAVMLIGALVVLGLVSLPRLDRRLLPEAELAIVTVTTLLPGAAPETIEREVTEPLEEAINTIDGIDSLTSTSSEGFSRILVSFGLDQDPVEKAQDVRDKVAVAVAELPSRAELPVVQRFDADGEPILAVLFAGPRTIRALTEIVEQKVKPRLERIAGVGSVEMVGGRKREIRIWLDPLRLSGYGMAVDDVLAALESEHVEMPGGRIETERREYTVRTQGKLRRAEQFGSLVVAERGEGVIRLHDVALVEDGMEDERTVSRLNGQRGVSLVVRRQSGANIVNVASAVKKELDHLRETLPPGVELTVAQDTSRFIEHSIDEVMNALFWGCLLATAVVLVFLRNGRSTIIAGLAIPSSVVASFAGFYFLGFTLNIMTLMGLSLSIGMLIDDAVVVVENIFRHVEGGEQRREAAHSATREVGTAVIATTLAVCAVFVPIAFMGGVVGKFFREFGLVVVCAVVTSTLVALTLAPMLSSRFLQVPARHGRAYGLLERGFVALERHYRRALAWSLGHRKSVVGVALAATLAGLAIAWTVPVDFAGEVDRSEFNVWLKMPLGSPIHRTVAAVAQLEESLRRHPEVKAVFSTIGGGARQRVNEAEIYVQLRHRSQRDVPQPAIMEDVRRLVRESGLPFVDFAAEEIPTLRVSGMRSFMMHYAVRGPETTELHRLAQLLTARMEEAQGFVDVTSSYELGKPEISLEIARDRAADLGVPAAQIGRSVAALLGGLEVTSFEEKGEHYDVRVQLRPEYRDDPRKLGLLDIRASNGQLINFANLVTPRIQAGPVEIQHEQRARVITVYANLAGKALGDASREMEGFIEKLDVAEGYEIEAVGYSKTMEESLQNVLFAFALAMVATYMILASQFNSFAHPFTIMLSAPLSFIGAFAGLAVAGHYLGVMSQIGFLLLMGLVMKNGILLVDYTNQLRERGMGLVEATLEAGPTRLRPVLMTTISTIFGMLPLALGRGDGAEWRNSMAVIVMGGLVTSMFLTLLVVPVAYTLLDDAQTGVVRLLGRLLDGRLALAAPAGGGGGPRGHGRRPRRQARRVR
jgi:HAE1 family hydrophobic/amphiphilic exporter-1